MGTNDDFINCNRRDAIKLGIVSPFGKNTIKTSSKSIARNNYSSLSSQQTELLACNYFDVLVIGSGYGGSILAARVSQKLKKGKTIAVLERGKEWVPGTFPERVSEVVRELSFKGPNRRRLYNLRNFNAFSVLQGVGLGGGSLINAGVALEPNADIFNKGWPAELNSYTLAPYYQRSRQVLRVSKGFDNANSTPKMDWMQDFGKTLHGTPGYNGFRRLDNTFHITKSNIGRRGNSKTFSNYGAPVTQAPSVMNGNGMLGCNVGAKNTLATSYLPIAKRNGAKIFTGFDAHCIEKVSENYYKVVGKVYCDDGRVVEKTLQARNVIVSAGTLGSTEILLNSQGSMSFSGRLGKRFHGNGDTLALLNRAGRRINPVGHGADKLDHIPTDKSLRVGNPIQSALDMTKWSPAPFLLQDLTYPQALGAYIDAITPFAANRSMMPFLLMSEDTDDGELSLGPAGRLKAKWPFETPPAVVDFLRSKLQGAPNEKLMFVGRGIVDGRIFGRRITAHPLGGACMGDSSDQGVVDACGRVFNAANGWIHSGLYVADGSIIPSYLLANPFLTISAVSERIADKFIEDSNNSSLFY